MPSDRTVVMDQAAIQAAIPHRPPMLLVDAVLEKTDSRIVCEKTFHAMEFFFQGHYPDKPIVPGVILCEFGMQSGAILLSQFADSQGTPVATRMNDVRFKRMVQPGDTVLAEIELSERLANAFFMNGKLTVDGKLAMRFEFACTVA
ncbi:MAG: 3-hydroxyacyl-ACP dehydratase FabZ family protein [Pirellulaceae bacterium]